MIKGKWVIIAILIVAVVMGIATWPLMGIRRRYEIKKTETLLEHILGACEQYRTRHGHYPQSLDALSPLAPLEYLDAWRRPIRYELKSPPGKPRLWSLGPNPDDVSDDISQPRRPAP